MLIKIQNQFAKKINFTKTKSSIFSRTLVKNKLNKLKILNLILTNNQCRTKQILKYFGEKSDNCNNCDACKKINYRSQLTIHISNQEVTGIKKLLSLKNNNYKINRQFPVTNMHIAFLAILKPSNKNSFLKIPGIGHGFIKVWSTKISRKFA